ncbi:5'-3' exonuclease [Tribonema minus]|uniref:5'-3' exonuclease n=1 Tax=Tribonema minus TaxID=303371 RepID=A0A835ZC56_9STRA|nr:5'-3' exonuclease [Tribonema minus]
MRLQLLLSAMLQPIGMACAFVAWSGPAAPLASDTRSLAPALHVAAAPAAGGITEFKHTDVPDETLWVLDGTSMLFRAHFGKGSQSYLAADGATEVAAVLAMGIELAQFIEEVQPRYLAVAFDVDRNSTFRRQLMPTYKAHRPPHPRDLLLQLPLATALTKCLGCTCLSQRGYEADDVMATLATWGRSIGLSVVLVSEDKDMLQLVRERVHVMAPRRCVTCSTNHFEVAATSTAT